MPLLQKISRSTSVHDQCGIVSIPNPHATIRSYHHRLFPASQACMQYSQKEGGQHANSAKPQASTTDCVRDRATSSDRHTGARSRRGGATASKGEPCVRCRRSRAGHHCRGHAGISRARCFRRCHRRRGVPHVDAWLARDDGGHRCDDAGHPRDDADGVCLGGVGGERVGVGG